MILAVFIDMGFLDTIVNITAVFAIRYTAFVECINPRTDLSQVQGIEGKVEKDHFCVRSITFTPIFFLTDIGTSCSGAVNVIDIVNTHHTDSFTCVSDYHEDNVSFAVGQIFDPFSLSCLSYRHIHFEELGYFRIVNPTSEQRYICRVNRTQITLFGAQEHYIVFMIIRFHICIYLVVNERSTGTENPGLRRAGISPCLSGDEIYEHISAIHKK